MSLIEIMIKLIIPRREKPVSSAQIPKVPPKLAILSDRVVLESSIVISTSGDSYFSRTIIRFFVKSLTLLKNVNSAFDQ